MKRKEGQVIICVVDTNAILAKKELVPRFHDGNNLLNMKLLSIIKKCRHLTTHTYLFFVTDTIKLEVETQIKLNNKIANDTFKSYNKMLLSENYQNEFKKQVYSANRALREYLKTPSDKLTDDEFIRFHKNYYSTKDKNDFKDIKDALIVEESKKIRANYIITDNISDFQKNSSDIEYIKLIDFISMVNMNIDMDLYGSIQLFLNNESNLLVFSERIETIYGYSPKGMVISVTDASDSQDAITIIGEINFYYYYQVSEDDFDWDEVTLDFSANLTRLKNNVENYKISSIKFQ